MFDSLKHHGWNEQRIESVRRNLDILVEETAARDCIRWANSNAILSRPCPTTTATTRIHPDQYMVGINTDRSFWPNSLRFALVLVTGLVTVGSRLEIVRPPEESHQLIRRTWSALVSDLFRLIEFIVAQQRSDCLEKLPRCVCQRWNW